MSIVRWNPRLVIFGVDFQNHCTHEITIFELFRGLQLQLSGVCRINWHYSYSFLVLVAECSYRIEVPSGIFGKFCNYSYMI